MRDLRVRDPGTEGEEVGWECGPGWVVGDATNQGQGEPPPKRDNWGV